MKPVISADLNAAIRSLEIKLRLLWIGVFPSFGIYAFLASLRAGREMEPALAGIQQMPLVSLLGLIVLVQSFVYRWFVLSPRGIALVLQGRRPSWLNFISNPCSPRGRAMLNQKYLDKLEGDELKLYEYSSGLFNSIIIQWGLINTCALFGMVLPPQQYQPHAAIIAAIVSSICLLLQFPGIGRSFAAGLELAEFERGMKRG